VTRHGSTALVAGDILAGEVCLVVYDGTRFQLLNPTSYTNLNVSGVLSLAAGAVGTPSLSAFGDVNTGLWFPAADTLAASVGGVEGWRLNSAGDLGIGTSSPGVKLDVAGEIRSLVSGGTPAVYLNNGSTQHSIQNNSGAFTFYNSGVERMRLDSSGNLGIGTSSPKAKLQSTGAAATTTPTGGSATGSAQYLTNTNDAFGMLFGISGGGAGWIQQQRTDATNTQYDLLLNPIGGNVGIGTSSPSQRLHLVGGNYRQNDATNSFGFEMQNGTGTSRIVTISGGSAFAIQSGNNGVDYLNLDGNGSVTIGSNVVATNATNGFLYVPTCAGVPTGTPTAKSGYAPIVVDTTNNRWYFYSGGAWRNAGP
jgi:hypothetical protein